MANPGLGFEAGAEYRFNDMFSVSAAITDLGFIKWKRDRSEIYTTKTFLVQRTDHAGCIR